MKSRFVLPFIACSFGLLLKLGLLSEVGYVAELVVSDFDWL